MKLARKNALKKPKKLGSIELSFRRSFVWEPRSHPGRHWQPAGEAVQGLCLKWGCCPVQEQGGKYVCTIYCHQAKPTATQRSWQVCTPPGGANTPPLHLSQKFMLCRPNTQSFDISKYECSFRIFLYLHSPKPLKNPRQGERGFPN